MLGRSVLSKKFTFESATPVQRRMRSDYETFPLLVLDEGALLLWSFQKSQWYPLVAPGLVLFKGPLCIPAVLGAGKTSYHCVEVTEGAAPLLDECMNDIWAQRPTSEPPEFAMAPISAMRCARFAGMLREQLTGTTQCSRVGLLGTLHTICQIVAGASMDSQMLHHAHAETEPFATLVREMRANPAAEWHMAKTAKAVGYSSHYFSRTFPKHVGMGFTEFLKVCRTERAIKLICSTDLPLVKIAQQCGAQSVRVMKAAVFAALGIPTIMLRTHPDPCPIDEIE